jgi:drug/metabolite transporter (DMT)-like permease
VPVLNFLLAIGASLSWGVSDFLGGLQTRASSVLRVLAISQPAGLALVTVALLGWGEGLPSGPHAWLAVAAGVFSVTSLGLFYAAMTKGSMIIVAPVAATGTVIPVIVGLIRGEALTAIAAAGIVMALVGAPLAAWEPGGRRGGSVLGVLLAAASGAGYGLWLTMMNLATGSNPLGATEVMRVSSCVLAVAAFGLHRRLRPGASSSAPSGQRPVAPGVGAVPPGTSAVSPGVRPMPPGVSADSPGVQPVSTGDSAAGRRPAGGGMDPVAGRRPAVEWLRGWLPLLAIMTIGLTDAVAEICFATASRTGELSIISPLSSLYPVVTVLLAAAVLRERVHPVQALGATAALAGAMLLAF